MLPPNCVKAILKILIVRNQFLTVENKFVFATKGEKQYHINGYQAMTTLAMKTSIRPVKKITASKIRKFVATNMLWMNVSSTERKL